MSEESDRLREHPKKRFSESVRNLDLGEEFERLLDEPHEPVDNHRQVTLVHRHGLSLILFYFETGGFMPDHEVDGEVSIHVLEGELKVGADGKVHQVEGGEILILAPGVEHDVEAVTETKMLLTIDMPEGEKT